MKQKTMYSIVQGNGQGSTHSLCFYWRPGEWKGPGMINQRSLAHAKLTLEYCRKEYPKINFRIRKTVTKTEVLGY